MNVRAHIVVKGLVQGVGFRFFVHRRAAALGIGGFVRNLYDGTVEIEAEGERSLVEELLKDVKVGPRSAHVTDMKIRWIEPAQAFQTFEVR